MTRIQWATDGWFVTTRQKIEGPLVLRSSTRVARSLILLHFGRPPGHPVTRPLRHFTVDFVVPVLPDSLDQESYRALQIFLRWQRAAVLNPLLAPEKGS
ncbi:MAG: hypothetical protein CSA49_05105 [Gammaproteobacteria bacterium]|nr:MAG: hypothetical protein CSA49_05105 [Gammaproteobacteria bacterium]